MKNFFIEFDINVKHCFLIISIICSFVIFEYINAKNIYTVEIPHIISTFASLILWIITKNSSEGEKNIVFHESRESNNLIVSQIEYNKFVDIKSKKEIIFHSMIIIFIYFFLELLLFIINFYNGDIFLIYQIYSILPMIIIDYFVFKNKIYLHHFISVITLFIFNSYHPKYKMRVIYYQKKTLSLLYYFTEGLVLFLMKYMMENKYVSPFTISFFKTFILVITIIIKYIFQINYKNIENHPKIKISDKYFKLGNENYDKQLYIFMAHCVFHIFNHLLIYFFSPFYYIISIEVGGMFNINNYQYIIHFIGCSLSIMIFCEIIIINFCGMGINTKKKISERGKLNANMQIESDLQSFGSHNYFSTKE